MNITIKKIPSFNSAKRLITCNPSILTNKQLLNNYAKVIMILNADKYGRLTDDYYKSALTASSFGYVPKDMWLNFNLKTIKEELWKEIENRGLTDFTVWDETMKCS